MRRWLIIAGMGAAAVTAVMLWMRRSSGYAGDEIDAAGEGATFGERDATAPEQRWAPAETRTGVDAEQLSMAARIGSSMEAIRGVWPSLTDEEVAGAEGDLDRLADAITEKTGQPKAQVRESLERIVAQETPPQSYPAH